MPAAAGGERRDPDRLGTALGTACRVNRTTASAAYAASGLTKDYGEVAEALGKSETACRQLVHRAKTQLQDSAHGTRCRARPSCACCAGLPMRRGAAMPSTSDLQSGYCTGDGFKFQISFAYSLMVRSLENFPQQATLMIALRAHASGSAYSAARSRWARA